MTDFSHIEDGKASMVDISTKKQVIRTAIAEGEIKLKPETIEAVKKNRIEKGNVLNTARIAGIQAVKKTPEMIPLCHPIQITDITIEFKTTKNKIKARSEVKTIGKTGVEMEAIHGVTTSLLTILDMVKSSEKNSEGQYPETQINQIEITKKTKEDIK
ncbi:cyclic pyranopterin monophosphate synthase MoaC [Methanonatronarchaeum sp. AMET6-2]|uniref:cyclic pyranopterin monophosphate synthase MoaC n=1 Tax=Methanonatronarchaeum sp. AMET6-2 TaxID=2933293 RepID=UPI00121F9FF4|nr:cyclic pyranopterin monophosphate synthase MoaC [Methanonatronarchaeum sp. AMET6-2]RZN62966.1 MAG: cyclic pyranopterin monophosphate synthase MoaC [Methanonatronarchaeia archaeon]UOY10735.1 cyclic pyranopterin monophosphate synthase MoaC [Methanonatronarchaeum sp. AMET6-2]